MNFEMNNARQDATRSNLHSKSPVVEAYSTMIKGGNLSELSSYKSKGKEIEAGAKRIEELCSRAASGDISANAELNNIRKIVIQPILLNELQLLGFFGQMQKLGYSETAEIDVYETIGVEAREQAPGTDVVFGTVKRGTTPIVTKTISSGAKVDYRRAQMGDMTMENVLIENVKTEMRNKALQYVIKTIYDDIKNATGVKIMTEAASITKSGLDDVLNQIRRMGKPSIVGDYYILSQITAFAGYFGTNGVTTFADISPAALEYFRKNGLVEWYNGCPLVEVSAGLNYNSPNATLTGFDVLSPTGLAYVIPSGINSPIKTVIRGDLTTLSGNDVTNGDIVSRFDIEIGAKVAPGREFMIGLVNDNNADGHEILGL